jgi:pimeloyl-ACP methyl ester carboxylesterase
MNWIRVAALAGFLTINGCGSGNNGSPPIISPSNDFLVSAQLVQKPLGVTSASSIRKLRYRMPAVLGGTTEANAMVFVPAGNAPVKGWPVVVWAHGTTGISDGCSPSQNYETLGDAAVVTDLLKAGYLVIAPDYEGLDAPGVHPYYSRTSHARSVLSALRATATLTDLPQSGVWAVMGHSQGGNVALAAAELQSELGANFKFAGVAAFAPGSNIALISDTAFKGLDTAASNGDILTAANILIRLNYVGALLAYGLQAQIPTFDPSTLFGARLKPILPIAVTDSDCTKLRSALIADLQAYLGGGGSISAYPGVLRDWSLNKVAADALSSNEIGLVRLDAPALIIQGDRDYDVPAQASDALVKAMRLAGSTVILKLIAGANHNDVINNHRADAISFLGNLINAK